jgi:hypothetical protein
LSSSEVLVRLGRTPLRYRFVRPAAPAVGRGLRPGSRLECRRPIGLPATFLEVTRGTPSSHPRVASSRVGLGRRRLALARARWPLGYPNDGAPSGRGATFAAGLLLSRRSVVRLTRRQDPEVASLEVFASPATYPSRAVLVRKCQPPDYPASAFRSAGVIFTQVLPASRCSCSFYRRRAQASHPGSFESPGCLGVAPRVIRARVLQVLSFVLRNRPAAGLCRGLAESHAVHHCTPIRQRSWGSIRACCPSQPSSSLAGVGLFPSHAPTCR